MLSSHREQENRLLSHQVPSKQQPKTPGMRYPKTPIGLGRGNENALAGFAGKNAIQGVTNLGENQKFISKKPMTTPTESRMRAPLGNKTTNAKAKNSQGLGIGGKSAVHGVERTELKSIASQQRKQRQRQRQAELAPKNLFSQLRDSQVFDHDEPEYAPPNPQPLPYQSDVFPRNGLTFKGLRKDNLLKGYYEHFYNPVDARGVSRMDKQLEDEIETAIEKAIERNDQDTDEFTWNSADLADGMEIAERMTRQKGKPASSSRQPTMVTRSSRSRLSVMEAPVTDDYEEHVATRSSRRRTVDPAMEALYSSDHSSPFTLRSRGESASKRLTRAQSAARDEFDNNGSKPAGSMSPVHWNASNESISGAVTRSRFSTGSDGEYAGSSLPVAGSSYQDSEDDEEFELRFDL
ncbi:hypothetical protein H0G86_012802 [Trichoderma simmonsii]|uniref:Uncharacterized protein n=1 Tax=Trichoderma simmonsii TaxID=1491479 RepID=A0A8G0LR35_9HYPO|nr:hypothetical protein H0G86_012802 [Trichoderma simmonsii]